MKIFVENSTKLFLSINVWLEQKGGLYFFKCEVTRFKNSSIFNSLHKGTN